MTRQRFTQLFQQAVPLHNSGNLNAAEAIYLQVLQEFPNNPDALHLLGVIAFQRRDYHRALGLLEHAIEILPKSPDFHGDLARALLKFGQFHRAADSVRNQLRLDPNSVAALSTLADALWRIGDLDQSIASARRAIELDPNSPGPHLMLAQALSHRGDRDSAIAAFRCSLRLNPNQPDAHSALIFLMNQNPQTKPADLLKEMRLWNQNFAKSPRLSGAGTSVPVSPVPASPESDQKPPNLIGLTPMSYHKSTGYLLTLQEAAPLQNKGAATTSVAISPQSKSNPKILKIGWLSPDFKTHVVARCMLPVFQAFSRTGFQHIAYSNVAHPDEMTAAIRQSVDRWQDIYGMDDQQAAQTIRDDQIDILIDLALHSGENRLPVFALKPAPIQLCYLGYPGGTGLDAMDYRISHPDLDPTPTGLAAFSEKTEMLTGSYLCYRPLPSAPDVAPLPALSNTFITFGCMNSASKISPESIRIWAELLQQTPSSRLILYSHAPEGRKNLLDQFYALGVAADRVEFIPYQPWPKFMETFNRIDIALDTFGYGAGITACDSLYMGVPIITLPSDRPVGRLCAHILRQSGLPDLIADSHLAFISIARQLAGNLEKLARLRSQLRPQLTDSPLMNAPSMARDFESAVGKNCDKIFAPRIANVKLDNIR